MRCPSVVRSRSLQSIDQHPKSRRWSHGGLGLPTVVCGQGSMSGQGHKADEYPVQSERQVCDAMPDRLLHVMTNWGTMDETGYGCRDTDGLWCG